VGASVFAGRTAAARGTRATRSGRLVDCAEFLMTIPRPCHGPHPSPTALPSSALTTPGGGHGDIAFVCASAVLVNYTTECASVGSGSICPTEPLRSQWSTPSSKRGPDCWSGPRLGARWHRPCLTANVTVESHVASCRTRVHPRQRFRLRGRPPRGPPAVRLGWCRGCRAGCLYWRPAVLVRESVAGSGPGVVPLVGMGFGGAW